MFFGNDVWSPGCGFKAGWKKACWKKGGPRSEELLYLSLIYKGSVMRSSSLSPNKVLAKYSYFWS